MPTRFQTKRLSSTIGKTIDAAINHELALSLLKQIADTPGPSQCLLYSRGRVIERVLNEHLRHHRSFRFVHDYQRTGNVAVMLGDKPSALFVAHADEISYLLQGEALDQEVPLVPFCNHKAKEEYPAVSLRYDPEGQRLKQSASGSILSRGAASSPYLVLKEGRAEIGDRVIFDYPLIVGEDNLVYGKVDNAAGVTACLLASIALTQLEPAEPIWFVFTDEEEGPADSNSTFARGARRLVQGTELPADTLCVVVDEYDMEPGTPLNKVLFSEKESMCRGNVVPPHLYTEFKEFVGHLQAWGIDIAENSGYVSRSDSPALMERFRNILLLGYSARNAHFDDGPPCTSLDAVVSLAKTIVWMALALDLG